jgi:hypothetical protein
MAFFPGQFNQAGGTWVDPSRVQTSQSGGAYIGGMAPQLPTQDMSFMWGGNGGAAAPAAGAAWNPNFSTPTTGWGAAEVMPWDKPGYEGPGLVNGASMYPGMPPAPTQSAGAPQTAPAAGGWSQSMLNTPAWAQPASTPAAQPGMTSTPSAGGYGDYSGSNPYQSGVADDMQRRVTEMLGQSFAGIRGNAVGTGGIGGSREGVAQGIAGQGAADSLAGQLAGMNSQNWNASQNRGLQQYGMDQNYNLGNQGQQLSFYNTQRGLDQTGYDLGLKALGLSQSGAWAPVQGMTGAVSPYTGNGTTTVNTSSGGGAAGTIGGIGSGMVLGRQMGWW